MSTVASGFVHRRATTEGGEHDLALDITSDTTPNYVGWIADLCSPYLGHSVLDVGAGHGAITERYASDREIVAVDASGTCVAAMKERFRYIPNVRVIHGDVRELGLLERFDAIVIINVLEHILDDSGLLRLLAGYLEPGGVIVVYVPALNGLYTAWDRQVGHFRRYSKRRLGNVISEAGMTTLHLRYVNLLAIPAWIVSGRMLKSNRTLRKSVGLWDRTGTRVGRAIESRLEMPIGLNLLCVAQPSAPIDRHTIDVTSATESHQ